MHGGEKEIFQKVRSIFLKTNVEKLCKSAGAKAPECRAPQYTEFGYGERGYFSRFIRSEALLTSQSFHHMRCEGAPGSSSQSDKLLTRRLQWSLGSRV